jgi:hypothetical protein
LQVEHEPVFTAAGDHVQARTNQLEQPFVAVELLHFERRDQPFGRQRVPVLAQACGTCDPDHHLQVTQPARAFLAVGFERVGRVFELAVALQHLQRLRTQKGLRVHRVRIGMPKAVEYASRAAQVTRFEQRCLHGHVALGQCDAFGHRAHAGADFEADVPACGDEGFDRCLQHLAAAGVRGRQQHQHVHIGVREQFATAITANREQPCACRHDGVLPERFEGLVDVFA